MSSTETTPAELGQAEPLSWLNLDGGPLPPDAEAVFERSVERLGYRRTMQQVLAAKPAALIAQDALSRALNLDPEAHLSPREREVIALVVSVENRCEPCVFGHAAQLREISGAPLWVATIEVNYRRAALTARERALADYAILITRAPAEIEEADLEPLRAAGVTDTGILEAAGIAAYFNFSNRVNSALGIRANPQAYHAAR